MKDLLFFTAVISLALALSADPASARKARRPARAANANRSRSGCVDQPNTPTKTVDGKIVVVKDKSVHLEVAQSLLDDAHTIATDQRFKQFNRGQVVVTDGFRSCSQNSGTRGSARNSAHLRGHAIDMRSNLVSAYTYAMAIQKAGVRTGPHKGGFYNTCVSHVHIDVEHDTFGNECGGGGTFGRRHPSRRSTKKRR